MMTQERFVEILCEVGFMPDVAEYIWKQRPDGAEGALTDERVFEVASYTFLKFVMGDE